MKKPELTAVGWLGPRDEMDRASHWLRSRTNRSATVASSSLKAGVSLLKCKVVSREPLSEFFSKGRIPMSF